ncbi:MAG: altronate dehydratase family protein [Oscillospiraceae bacterium]|nr:altronate dehydratase family protein [Oscillospiraceae bacterium]
MDDLFQINQADNVAVALKPIVSGTEMLGFRVQESILAGHKVALNNIPLGGDVVKHGFPIGKAAADIPAGGYVHTHNVETRAETDTEYRYQPAAQSSFEKKTGSIWGYMRSDGSYGIRNEVWIVNTVGCVNKVSERIADEANKRYAGRVDGIYAVTHSLGCQLGSDYEATRRILTGLVRHPNAGGILVLGLGCESNGMEAFQKLLGDYDPERVKFLVAQEHEDEEKAAMELIEGLILYAGKAKRCEFGLDKLVIGLKCGGSDRFSSVTANPLVGCVADTLRAYGGTAILTETPEMFGAEQVLMNRCQTPALFEKTVGLAEKYKAYYNRYGQGVCQNSSPGNESGVTTQEEKSLGYIQKGGSGAVTDVLGYGERACLPGLTLLDAPPDDLISMTALTAAGAHIILFTTGRGTPAGAFVPTIKIASNPALAAKKAKWIDFNAGALLDGTPMEKLAEDLWYSILTVAEGRMNTKNELYGGREIAILKTE